jgi:hypothetical protein
LPERPKDKTSAERRKEKHEQKLAEAKKLSRELSALYNKLKSKFTAIGKTGEIPDEGALRGFRKNLQYLSSGLRKLRRAGVEAPFGHGQVNQLTSKLNKWIAGEGVKGETTKGVKSKEPELDEIITRIKPGAAIYDPAIHNAIRMLREIAKDRIKDRQTTLVVDRAKKLMLEGKRSEAEIQAFVKNKLVLPILSSVFRGFLSKLESRNVELHQDVRNYVETCIKGGKSTRDFVSFLLEGYVDF